MIPERVPDFLSAPPTTINILVKLLERNHAIFELSYPYKKNHLKSVCLSSSA